MLRAQIDKKTTHWRTVERKSLHVIFTEQSYFSGLSWWNLPPSVMRAPHPVYSLLLDRRWEQCMSVTVTTSRGWGQVSFTEWTSWLEMQSGTKAHVHTCCNDGTRQVTFFTKKFAEDTLTLTHSKVGCLWCQVFGAKPVVDCTCLYMQFKVPHKRLAIIQLKKRKREMKCDAVLVFNKSVV